MNEDRLSQLESRYLWLERHVGEQDRAMLALSDELRRMREEFQRFRDRTETPGETAPPEAEPPPPHY